MTRAGTTNALSRPLFDPDPDWMRRGACKGQDTEVWFASDTTEAKATCHRCPVRTDCLAWAMANGLDHGVWGGMGEKERKALKKRETNKAEEVQA
jgi:WhiB family redox-sensing transcriptional regulator